MEIIHSLIKLKNKYNIIHMKAKRNTNFLQLNKRFWCYFVNLDLQVVTKNNVGKLQTYLQREK